MSMDPTDFRGGAAVITGAGSGLGAGLVTYAANLGMRVALADIDVDAIEQRAAALGAEGVDAIARRVDVRKWSDLEALADDVYAAWGTTTILVNNAGVELLGNTWEVSPEMWHRVIDINLNGVFHGIRAFVPRMLAQRGRAHVVNIASLGAMRINLGTSAYTASKHANLALTECLAGELAAVTGDVFATVVLPGPVRSNIFERALMNEHDETAAQHSQQLSSFLVEQGMDPVEAAEIIFAGAGRGDLRVHTHPEMSRWAIDERTRALAS